MTILAGDVKLMASEVMDDVPEGGGAPTSAVIQDGVSNAIFPDISELDRAGGDVSMRKAFVRIATDTRDTYLGANIIVADAPDDPRVSMTIFSTKSVFDRRDAAKSRVEAYLATGPDYPAILFENHIQGQRQIALFQRPTDPLPPVGRTLQLLYNAGLSTERSQYVRITDTSGLTRTFTYASGDGFTDFVGTVVTCDISDALRYDFPGSPPTRTFSKGEGKTFIKDTVVADAAVYFGTSKLDELAVVGDLSVKVESIYTQLVPSAQTEIPILNANAAGEYLTLTDGSNGFASFSTTATLTDTTSLYLGNSVLPGSVSIAYSGGTLNDSGGQMYSGSTVIGLIDYATGVITWASTSPGYFGSKNVSFRVSGAPLRLSDSSAIDVTQENRAYNYSLIIDPPPAPGSLRISYMVQGNWYTIKDDGSGALRGADSTYGSGTVSFTTGVAAITCGALPDAGSAIIFQWGSQAAYFNRAPATPNPLTLELTLTEGVVPYTAPGVAYTPVAPSTFTLSWSDGTSTFTATDDGYGNITGTATGYIQYATGVVRLTPTNLPLGGQVYTATYQVGPAVAGVIAATGTTSTTVTLAGNLIPKTVFLSYAIYQQQLRDAYVAAGGIPSWAGLLGAYPYYSSSGGAASASYYGSLWGYGTIGFRDDGVGGIVDVDGNVVGTVNYTTGVCTFDPRADIKVRTPRGEYLYKGVWSGYDQYGFMQLGYDENLTLNVAPDPTGYTLQVLYRSSTSVSAKTQSLELPGLFLDLTKDFSELIIPGSVNFNFGGKTYFDRLGRLYTDLDYTTGAASLAGTIDYTSGVAQITSWVPGGPNTITLKGLVTSMDVAPIDAAVFRTPIAPLKSGSVQVTATRATGGNINVTADITGEFDTTDVQGTVDYQTGIVRLRFGTWVVAAGNEDEPWYLLEAIREDGKIFQPKPVLPDSLRYNANGYTYLPLDADLLGLDPVRLPQDGRVVIYRKGGFVVVGHSASVSRTQAVGTYDVGRVRLSRVRILGANGTLINTGYTANLESGVITFTDVTGYDQPITIENRIEDMAQVSDVQINGQLAFTRQLTHDYPVGSYCSSALIAGDLKARVSVFFDQQSFSSGVWSDSLIGNSATASYNQVQNPVIVTNDGALDERWALVFLSATSFNIIGENVGIIAQGNTSIDIAPLNPATGTPYWTLSALGWGLGWATGNVLRFNTVGSTFPVWLVRTVQQGEETVTNDSFTLLIRGDVDNPI